MKTAAWIVASIVLICSLASAADDEKSATAIDKAAPGSLAHYRFNGNGKDEKIGGSAFVLNKAPFRDNALYLNGIYDSGNLDNAHRAVVTMPKLDYNTFTVAMRFKAEDFADRKSNLLTGGPAFRWFGLSRSDDGKLNITLNNQRYSQTIGDTTIDKDHWNVVACGVDVPSRKVVTYFNCKKVKEFELPKGLKLDVVDSKFKDTDKSWTFTNYSNGTVFHGLIDELIIYGKLLTPGEFEAIPLRP